MRNDKKSDSSTRPPVRPVTEQFYQALKLRKVDAALVRVPGASHDIGARPSQTIAKTAVILKWFETRRHSTKAKNSTN